MLDAGSGFEIFLVSFAWVHCGRWPGERKELEVASSFPYLEAELRRLEQVLSNLVSNALKFIPGAARVGAACNPKEIAIWVKDTVSGFCEREWMRLCSDNGCASSSALKAQGKA